MLNEPNNKRIYKGQVIDPLKTINIANNGSSQCKRAVGAGYYDQVSDKTITCYSGEGMNVYLGEYNHQSKIQEPASCIYENNMHGRWDYHNYANLVKAPDGEKVVFFVKHTKEMYMIKSPLWEKVTISKDFPAYPAPVVAGEDMYIFYSRHDNEVNGNIVDGIKMHPYRSLWYIKSTDSGETWEPAVKVIDTKKQCPREIDEVYLCGSTYFEKNTLHPNRIQLAWTMWGGLNGHASSNEAAYCCYLSLEDMKVYSPSGELIGDTIDYKEMVNKCQVYLTPEYNDEAMSVASVLSTNLKSGHIMVIYGVLKENKMASIRSAEWSGGKWKEIIISENTYSVKDVYRCKKSGKIKIVYAKGDYLIIDEYDEESRIWETKNTTKIEFRNGSSSVQFANFILNHKPDLQVITGQVGEKVEDLYKGIWPITAYGKE